MNIKEQYFKALKANNGTLDEIELGRSLFLDEETTTKIISRLLSENKIEYTENQKCSYSLKTKTKPIKL